MNAELASAGGGLLVLSAIAYIWVKFAHTHARIQVKREKYWWDFIGRHWGRKGEP
jgi:hypothetical protein